MSQPLQRNQTREHTNCDSRSNLLPTGRAVVFHTRVASTSVPRYLPACVAMLSRTEQERQQAFRFPQDQHLFAYAHALLRTSLSRFADIPPADWKFETGAHGRPELCRLQGEPTQLRFNLSHTRGFAACAITREADIGIDVERLDRNVDLHAIAERHFAPSEVDHLTTLAASARRRRFLEFWTLKEAYVKACGGGLTMSLRDFHFEPGHDGQWRIGFADPDRQADHWQFTCTQPTPHHIMSTAIHCRNQPEFAIHVEESAPVPSVPTRQDD